MIDSMNYFFNLNADHGWLDIEDVIVRGAAYDEDILFKNLQIIFKDVLNPSDFILKIETLNGFYAVVMLKNGILMAAVDRVRSIPLFYACNENKDKLYLSDDAEWVRLQVEGKHRDTVAETEFLFTGYVTGEDTLYPEVKQLQAGEALIAYIDGDKIVVKKDRYYRYLHTEKDQDDKEEMMYSFDQVVINCIQRLIHFADGRAIVLPLSGGFDSRLIAATLKRLGYDHIVAFSYGRLGNSESKTSKWVAECLGIPWYFVPYSNETWWEWFHSEERESYYRLAHNLSSLPHMQDWPAVKVLKSEGVIETDSIFVPGHTGDFLAGGHIPDSFFMKPSIGDKLFLDEVIKKHYSLWPFNNVSSAIKEKLKDRILKLAEADDLSTPIRATAAFEKWEWQERQAKFIINSVRVYEFWGYDWWLPLWDAEMMDFWAKIPMMLKKKQKFYIDYVTQMYAKVTGLTNSIASQSSNISTVSRLKQTVKCTPLYPLANSIYEPLKKRREYENHPMAWYGMIEKNRFYSNINDFESINSFLVKEILGIELL